jgi:outer membrane receptor protein involved in Fe transport
MKKWYGIALMGFAFTMSQNAFAEVVNVTNSADGATRDAAIAAVKEKLTSACTERGGKPDSESFKLDGEQKSSNFEYAVLPNGDNAPNSHTLPIDERTRLEDRRNFTGAYGELHFAVTEAWRIEAGVRLNHTAEKREGEVIPSDSSEEEEIGSDKRNDTRWAGSLGTSFNLWRDGADGLTAFANYRNSYKPAVIDFGPEAEGEILKPETAHSWEAGLKGEHMGGRFEWELSLFRMDFKNLVVTQEVDGLPGLTNAGGEKFKGAELEARYRIDEDLSIKGSWSYHDARFGDYVQLFGDTPTQLRGKQLELSPRHLGSVGLLWAPVAGFNGNIVANWVGPRFLNKRNTAPVGGYTTWDAGLGYRFDAWEVRVDGYNLSDNRDPAAESELGDAQYYRMPARSYWLSARFNFGK